MSTNWAMFYGVPTSPSEVVLADLNKASDNLKRIESIHSSPHNKVAVTAVLACISEINDACARPSIANNLELDGYETNNNFNR